MPARHFSSVLLPLPLRPTIPKNSPGATANEMSFSACSCSWRERRSGCSARSLSVWLRSSGILKRLLTPWAASAGRPDGAVWSCGTFTQGIASARSPKLPWRSPRSAQPGSEWTGERSHEDENTRDRAKERTDQRRPRAEREQGTLNALGERAVWADQAQPEAALGVERVVHRFRVFALAEQARDFLLVLDAQPRFALDDISAERRRVANGRRGSLLVDLDHRARGRIPRERPRSLGQRLHVAVARIGVAQHRVRPRGAPRGVPRDDRRRLLRRGLGERRLRREHARDAAQRRLKRHQSEALVHRWIDDRARMLDQPRLL